MTSDDGASPLQWTSIEQVVDVLSLDVDPADVSAVVQRLRQGMIASQNTATAVDWVSAYKFVTAPRAVLPTATSTVPAGRTHSSSAMAPYEARRRESLRSGLEAIQRTFKRSSITLGMTTAIVGAIWTFPNNDNPLLRQLSPYAVREGISGEEELIFDTVRTFVWLAAMAIALVAWALAFLRHRFQSELVTAAHEPATHARALERLRNGDDQLFTQVAFEQALVAEADPRRADDRRSASVPGAPMGTHARWLLGGVSLLGAALVIAGTTLYSADQLSYNDGSVPFFVVVAGAVATVALTVTGLRLLAGANRTDRVTSHVLSTTGTDDELHRVVREASDLALERYLDRGTLVAVPDVNFLPSYGWAANHSTENSAGR